MLFLNILETSLHWSCIRVKLRKTLFSQSATEYVLILINYLDFIA